MNTRVYVDNLTAATTESELMELFSAYGNIVGIKLVVDRTVPKPRGFGFVTMVTPEGARAAIEALNGKAMGEGNLVVSEGWSDEEHGSGNGPRTPRRRASQLY